MPFQEMLAAPSKGTQEVAHPHPDPFPRFVMHFPDPVPGPLPMPRMGLLIRWQGRPLRALPPLRMQYLKEKGITNLFIQQALQRKTQHHILLSFGLYLDCTAFLPLRQLEPNF